MTDTKIALKYKTKNVAFKKAKDEFVGWSENDFIRYILDIRKKMALVETQMSNYQKGKVQKESPAGLVFKRNWTIANKIHYVLLQEQKPLTTEQIFNELVKLDFSFKNYNQPLLVLSSSLGKLVKIKRFKKEKQAGLRSNLYYLPEWFDEHGNLHEAYKTKPNYF